MKSNREIAVANGIVRLAARSAFGAPAASRVSALSRAYPRSAEVALAAAEYFEEKYLTGRPRNGPARMALHERRYQRAIRLDPENARAWKGLVRVLDIAGRLDEAAAAARRSVRLDREPEAVAILARTLAQQNHRAEAGRLARAPHVAKGTSKVARQIASEVRAGVWFPDVSEERRERRYQQGVERHPQSAKAWKRLAMFLDVDGRLNEASKAARNAVKHGGNADSMMVLARILAQQNRRAQAIKLAEDPKVARARSGFARDVSLAVRQGKWFPSKASRA